MDSTLSGKKKEVEPDIVVYNIDGQQTIGLITIAIDSMLSDVRKQIQESWRDLGKFQFVKNGVPISLGSQKKKRLSTLSQKQIFIKLIKKDKKEQEPKIKQEKLKQCLENKQKIESLLKDVDAFALERKTKTQLSEAEAAKRLQDIETKMKSFGVELKFANTDAFLEEARNILKNNSKDSDQFIQELKATQDISEIQMIQNSGFIGKTYYHNTPTIARILDYSKLSYNVDNSSGEGGETSDITFYSKQKSEVFSKSFNQKNTSGEINAVGIAPFALVKAGFDACATQQLKKANQRQSQSQYSKTFLYSVHVGKALAFTKDSMAIDKMIRDKYESLVQRYFQKSNMELLKKDCIQFFKQYGYEMDVGTYSFGTTYMLENELFFNQKVSASLIDSVSASSLNAAIHGGFISQYGMMAGKGDIHSKQNSGSSDTTQNLNVSYTTKKNVKANPNVQNINNWRNLAILNRGSWRVLGAFTQKIPIIGILRNQKNSSEYLKKLQKEQRLFQFQKFAAQVYNETLDGGQKNQKKQSGINIVLVGPSGSGKSYFGNQLIGRDIIQPFKSSAGMVAQTFDPQMQKTGIYSIYDTPGLFDNRGLQSGQIPRKLSQIINVNANSKQYKYINAFLLVVKVVDRIIFKPALMEIVDIYGIEVLKSLILILNFPQQKKDFSVQTLVDKIGDFGQIRKLNPSFDYESQVFWNYKFDLEKQTLYDWFLDYSSHRTEIFNRVKSIKIYDSNHYQAYKIELQKKQKALELEQAKRKKQEQQRVRLNAQKIQKQKSEALIKMQVQNFVNNLSYFTLKCSSSQYYIGYGPIANYIVYIPKGFNLFSRMQLLFLSQIKINYEQGRITGHLGSQDRDDMRMSTDGTKQLGYRDPRIHNIQRVAIQFETGRAGLIAFATMQQPYLMVKVSIQGEYLFDNNGELERAKGNVEHEKMLFSIKRRTQSSNNLGWANLFVGMHGPLVQFKI